MPEATFQHPELAPVLAACEAAAPTPGQGREAFQTWVLAQVMGWDDARALRASTRATWYRHLRHLSRAGLAVPAKLRSLEAAPAERLPAPAPAAGHAGAKPWALRFWHLTGKTVRVTAPWDEAPGTPQAGTVGEVFELCFYDGQWLVGVEFDGPGMGDEHLPVGQFLAHLEVLE